MIRIRPTDLTNEIYRGQRVLKDDVLDIPESFGKVIFPSGLEAKEVRVGKNTTFCVSGPSRIRRLLCGGDSVFIGNCWLGDARNYGDLIVDGDLSVWMGDLLCNAGNVCVSGDIRIEGHLTCRAGVVIASGLIETPHAVIAAKAWSGSTGEKFPRMAESAAHKADMLSRHVARKTGKS